MEKIENLQKQWGIGLTGGIACGKSTVSGMLRQLGFSVIDADQLARRAVEPGSDGLKEVLLCFGESLRQQDGSLNRGALKEIVFRDAKARAKLESITHPIVANLLLIELKSLGLCDHPRLWFFEVPLLIETGNHTLYKAVWVVECSRDTQLKRIQARDHVSRALAEKIVESQMPGEAKAAFADLVINTDVTLTALQQAVMTAVAAGVGGPAPR